MTVKELLSDIDAYLLKVLVTNSTPDNKYALPDITNWRFCDVMDIVGMDLLHAAIKTLSAHKNMTEDDVMNSNGVEFVCYMKWLQLACEKVSKLMEMLSKEPDADLVNSGIDKMDRYGVASIYYGISKDPSDWDRLSEVPFHMMYTKLMIDKDSAEIQENYSRIMSDRQKSKQR